MKKFLSIIFAVMMIFSAFSANVAAGSYPIYGEDFDGNSYVKAVVNGTYEVDDYTDPSNPVQYMEVGSTLTIDLPFLYVSIHDSSLNSGGLWYAEDNIVYDLDANGVHTDTGACTVTNLSTGTYTTDYGEVETYYKPGITICFNQPGEYDIQTSSDYINGVSLPHHYGFWQSFKVLEKGGIAARNQAFHTALYTNATVLVNGVPTSFEAYNIGGNNYFKLRDLAMALNGTSKQFEITWDAANSRIALLYANPYTPVGGELVPGDGTSKQWTEFSGSVAYTGPMNYGQYQVENSVLELKACNINGNNYFKLRDVCSTLNVGVTWDAATQTIGLDTALPYTG